MLLGNNFHSIDDKGRIAIPAQHRKNLGESVYAACGVSESVAIYSEEQWEKWSAKLMQLGTDDEDIRLFFFSSAAYLNFDKQGRILLPAHLREYAGLSEVAVVAGAGDKLLILNTENWKARGANMTPKNIAGRLKEMGI